MGFISWLNKLLNPNHNWTDYDENGNMTARGLGEGLNSLLNPNHNWTDWDKYYSLKGNFSDALSRGVEQLADPEQITSFVNSQTGAHMVNADIERNEMQMQNQEDIFQRQVTGMQKAGINPALMYNSGASSGPSAPAPTQPGLNMSDIMQAVLLDKQGRLLESQIRNTDAQTDREAEETNRLKLINKYYPELTETEIDKMLSEIGYNDEAILKMKSEIELQDLEKDLKTIQKIISQAEADESSAYYKARRELLQAQTDKEKQEKAELVVRTAMETIERDFMKETNTKMGSATIVAIASALGTLLSNFELPGIKNPFEGASESFLRDMRKLRDWFKKHTTAVD